jgi:uncharacterized membrane protein
MSVDLWSFMGPFVVLGFVLPLLITVLVVGVIVWSIRRAMPKAEDPAIAELKGRLARGEIDPTEFQVRLRALSRDD